MHTIQSGISPRLHPRISQRSVSEGVGISHTATGDTTGQTRNNFEIVEGSYNPQFKT